jgi:hypothetical protein
LSLPAPEGVAIGPDLPLGHRNAEVAEKVASPDPIASDYGGETR